MKVKFLNITDLDVAQLKNIVGNDLLRPVMMGVYIDFKDQVIVGTDAKCLITYPVEIVENDSDKEGVIVPIALFNRLRYMVNVPVKKRRLLEPEFILSDDYAEVYFCNELVFRCKYIEGKYPDYKAIMPVKADANDLKDIGFRLSGLKRLSSALPDLDDEPLNFTFFQRNRSVLFESTANKYGRAVRGIIMPSEI